MRELAPRVFELSELLVRRMGVEDVAASFHHRVTYHPTCHSLRLLKVGDAPLALMLTDKLRRILDTRADVCTAADSSCLMHIGGGLQHARAGVRVMHLAEILASEDS